MTLAVSLVCLLELVSPGQNAAVRVLGSVEITPVEAMRTAEEATIRTLWERYGDAWRERRSVLVPAVRLEQRVQEWLRGSFQRLDVVRREKIEGFETTAGKAYQQSFIIDVQGAEAHEFRRRGTRLVERLNRTYRNRSIAIGAVWLLLLLTGLRLDRVTRGYLTGRILVGAIVLAAGAAVLMYP